MNGDSVQLSKWWKTPSAQAAFDRAEQTKRAKLDALRVAAAAAKAKTEAAMQLFESEVQ